MTFKNWHHLGVTSWVEKFPVVSPRENNQKLLHTCDMWSCNIGDYLIKHLSEKYITIGIIIEEKQMILCSWTVVSDDTSDEEKSDHESDSR